MLKIAICDDEMNEVQNMYTILETIAAKHDIRIEIDDFLSGANLLEHIKKNNAQYDVIYLDIEMNDMDGIEVARGIRQLDGRVYLIYVTGYENYALEAYEVHPYHFILKPTSVEVMEKYFLNIYENISSEAFYYEYYFKKDYYRILVNEILYFESDKRCIKIYMNDGEVYTYYDKLDVIEEKMKNSKADFWRIHQSFLINARYIRHKGYDYVELINGMKFLISRDRRKEVNIQYIGEIKRKIIKR